MCKILRVSTYPTEENSGMGLHPYKICGVEGTYTYYLSPKDNGTRKETPNNTELVEALFYLKPRPRGKVGLLQLFFLFKRLFYILTFSFYGCYLILKRNIDIVHIHSPMHSLMAFLGWALGKTVFITFHGSDFHRIKNSALYRRFSFIYDQVFCISPDMLFTLSDIHGENKVHQVMNGISRDSFVKKSKHRKKQILAVGSLKEEKGFDDLIAAYELFVQKKKENSEYNLVIVGEGILRDDLQCLIDASNYKEKISLLGHRSSSELINIYNESELFVLSSISEGFPKVLLEAMSCGCLIVATKVGSVPEILKGYPYLANIRSPSELAERIRQVILLENKEPLLEYYEARLNDYSWDSVQEFYTSFYKGIQ